MQFYIIWGLLVYSFFVTWTYFKIIKNDIKIVEMIVKPEHKMTVITMITNYNTTHKLWLSHPENNDEIKKQNDYIRSFLVDLYLVALSKMKKGEK